MEELGDTPTYAAAPPPPPSAEWLDGYASGRQKGRSEGLTRRLSLQADIRHAAAIVGEIHAGNARAQTKEAYVRALLYLMGQERDDAGTITTSVDSITRHATGKAERSRRFLSEMEARGHIVYEGEGWQRGQRRYRFSWSVAR